MALAVKIDVVAGGETRQLGASASRPIFQTYVRLAGDDGYLAGGSTDLATLIATTVNKETVEILYVVNSVHAGSTAGGVAPGLAEAVYDNVADKLLVRSFATGTEATDSDLSALELRLWVAYR